MGRSPPSTRTVKSVRRRTFRTGGVQYRELGEPEQSKQLGDSRDVRPRDVGAYGHRRTVVPRKDTENVAAEKHGLTRIWSVAYARLFWHPIRVLPCSFRNHLSLGTESQIILQRVVRDAQLPARLPFVIAAPFQHQPRIPAPPCSHCRFCSERGEQDVDVASSCRFAPPQTRCKSIPTILAPHDCTFVLAATIRRCSRSWTW